MRLESWKLMLTENFVLMSLCMVTLKLKFMDSECWIHLMLTATPLLVSVPASIRNEPIQVTERQPENQSRNNIGNRCDFSTENSRIARTTTPIPQTRCIWIILNSELVETSVPSNFWTFSDWRSWSNFHRRTQCMGNEAERFETRMNWNSNSTSTSTVRSLRGSDRKKRCYC